MALHSIELCAGVGMLGEGVRTAFEFFGIEHRTVCYVEREAAAAAQLARLMEAGALDSAPVWSDLLTFDGAAWRGLVDFLVAGFPCQDISIAGRRAGLDGKRSGLFFDILDLADDCGAGGLFLENVSAIATATASAVDETEGELFERAAARVVGELADRGWDAEWITLSASDVGASHRRARWFCLAWRRLANTGYGPRAHQQIGIGRCGGQTDDCAGSQTLDAVGGANNPLCDPECAGLATVDERGRCAWIVADACEPGLSDAEQKEPCRSWAGHEGGAASELRGTPLFAPGPIDPRWPGVVANRPDLAPAVEPGVRMLADGMAYLVDESRAHQLRQVGNGVVPLQAAVAFVELLRRARGN